MTPDQQSQLQSLPQVNALLDHPRVRALLGTHPRSLILDEIRATLDAERQAILNNAAHNGFDLGAFVDTLQTRLESRAASTLQPVINATGVIVHTNLGRAPLAPDALDAARAIASTYANVEYDLETGARGSRLAHVEGLLTELTGAEAALVVNNNAAAVLLALNTFALDAGVIVSRGELVEIGGSFRIPEVVQRGMAKLVEVGTTNKTRLSDYRDAITADTRILLKVHPSNYRIVGFTESVSREQLVALARERNLLFMEDLGSGALVDLADFGLPHETTLQEAVATGVDVVTASGDKLLGGPQCGIVLGRRDAIDTMKRNPLMRALRVDKMCLAALDATLRIYRNPQRIAAFRIPALNMMASPVERIRQRAEAIAASLQRYSVEITDGLSYAGGGALPGEGLPTALLALHHPESSPDELAAALRRNTPPIIARIQNHRLILDLRTVAERDDNAVKKALLQCAQGRRESPPSKGDLGGC